MPYWRLASFYFFYFASVGVLVPFWALYLKDRGFGTEVIGQLMAILLATKIIAPYLWGWIADHTGARVLIVRIASLLSLVIYAGIFAVNGFWGLAMVMALFSFFWNASLPQMEAITLNHLGPSPHRYTIIRLWGSIGFIIAVLALGAILERTGTDVIPQLVLLIYVAILVSTLTIPESARPTTDQASGSVIRLVRRPEVAALLIACFLMQASHAAFYVFYSIYLTEAGYTSFTVGGLLAWGVVLEVVVFIWMHQLLERFGARDVLLVSLGLAVVRWLLTGGFVDSPAVQVFAQSLHAATFGTYHAAAIHLVHHYFSGRTQGRGQALYSSSSFGAGGAAGSLLTGMLWSSVGGAITFGLSALVAGLGWLAIWGWVDRERRY